MIDRAGRGLAAALIVGLALLGGAARPAPAQEGGGDGAAPPVPPREAARHLGVATCASSTCHGAAAPVEGGTVWQSENTTWQNLDKHSTAFAVLSNERSKRIARNMRIGDPTKAKVCLDCHADNVPEERRGPQFQLADGVGCEACHGGSESWAGVHVIHDNATSHARNVSAGLYPTENPRARAKLCLSCHFGDDSKLVTHQIMGADHPRLSFELTTFTAIEPAHYQVDADYKERKRFANDVKTWAIGQALAVVQTLDTALNPKQSGQGLFPELVLFDCHACHRLMSDPQWKERGSVRLGPGVVPFNDANVIMLRLAARPVSAKLAQRITANGRALLEAGLQGRDEWVKAAQNLRQAALDAADAFEAHEFGDRDMRTLLDALVSEGARGEYVNYMAGEQTTMAMGSILTAMQAANVISPEEYDRVKARMDEVYASVEKDEQYKPTAHLAAIRRLQAASR